MSKTIEERAKDFVARQVMRSYEDAVAYLGETYCNAMMESYTEVACEQRKVDIDKACEWMKQNLWTFTYTKHGETNYDVDLAVERFKQAMEE